MLVRDANALFGPAEDKAMLASDKISPMLPRHSLSLRAALSHVHSVRIGGNTRAELRMCFASDLSAFIPRRWNMLFGISSETCKCPGTYRLPIRRQHQLSCRKAP
jgi:hypothetical protein